MYEVRLTPDELERVRVFREEGRGPRPRRRHEDGTLVLEADEPFSIATRNNENGEVLLLHSAEAA